MAEHRGGREPGLNIALLPHEVAAVGYPQPHGKVNERSPKWSFTEDRKMGGRKMRQCLNQRAMTLVGHERAYGDEQRLLGG